jgi:hypothetical protein
MHYEKRNPIKTVLSDGLGQLLTMILQLEIKEQSRKSPSIQAD